MSFNKISFEQAKQKYKLIPPNGLAQQTEQLFNNLSGQVCVAFPAGDIRDLYNIWSNGSGLVTNIHNYASLPVTIKTGPNTIMKQIVERLESLNINYDVWIIE